MEVESPKLSRPDTIALPVPQVESRRRYNLLRLSWMRRILVSRWPLLLARAITLAGFVFVILAGLFGSLVGSHNFAIIFVWIAFTVSFAFPKISYVLSVVSDPLGWGWNLFGTAGTAWNPDVSGFSPLLQVLLLLAGLFFSGKVALHQTKNSSLALSLLLFSLVFTLAMMGLLVG